MGGGLFQTGGKKQLDLHLPDGGYGQWVAIDVTELPQAVRKKLVDLTGNISL
jgi:hypothetical protein